MSERQSSTEEIALDAEISRRIKELPPETALSLGILQDIFRKLKIKSPTNNVDVDVPASPAHVVAVIDASVQHLRNKLPDKILPRDLVIVKLGMLNALQNEGIITEAQRSQALQYY